MGLRFRRSIKICKGVKVNLGKTGASLSVGTRGFHKTFHTSGRVTTTVGLPGTGIYWTESTNPRHNNNNTRNTNRRNNQVVNPTTPTRSSRNNTRLNQNSINEFNNFYEEENFVGSIFDRYDEFEQNDEVNEIINTDSNNDEDEIETIDFGQIYKYSDYPIDWIDIANSETSEELDMPELMWQYCKENAESILDGNIDKYLDVIETLRPVDDLLLYAGDFEFGTDKSNSMTVEYTAKIDNYQPDQMEELINSVAIRVARDIMALLPVIKVEVIVVNEFEQKLLEVTFNKRSLRKINFHALTAIEIVSQIKNERV